MEKHNFLSFLIFIVALMVISITVFSGQSLKETHQAKTGFSFTNDTLDIGLLPSTREKEIPIAIYNHEDSTLVVQDIVSSCGCVLTDKKNFQIGNHDSAIVNTTIQAKKSETEGAIYRTIAVRTNYIDPIKYIVLKGRIS